MQIVQAPNSVLSEKAKPIKKIDKNILDLIEGMKYTLVHATNPEGIGLAAPQVGKSVQLFIIKENKHDPFFVFINPQLILLQDDTPKTNKHQKGNELQDEQEEDHRLEGCLSLKDIWGTVKRAPRVDVKYIDETGTKHEKIFTGFFATIIQHEYDHLQGILFPKRTLEQQGELFKSHKNGQGKEIFDPIDI